MLFVLDLLMEGVCRSLLSGLDSLTPSVPTYHSQVSMGFFSPKIRSAHFVHTNCFLQSEFNLQSSYRKNQALSKKAFLATGGICH